MSYKDQAYQFYFPNYFARLKDFAKHLKHPDKFEDFCLGKREAYYIDEGNYGTRRNFKQPEAEKYKREYLWNEFITWRKWSKAGSNIFSFSEDLLQLLVHTDVENIELETLKFPYNNFYLSLRHLELPFVENEANLIDGVYIDIEYNNNFDEEATFDFSITLDFAGDYERFAVQYNDSISEIFRFTFKHFNLTLDKKSGILNVQQALLENREYFRQALVFTDEDKLIDIFKFNQELIERTIRVVVNCLLYLSLPDKDLKQDFAKDLPAHLIAKLANAKTKRKKEVAKNEIQQLGFTKINFVGQGFSGTLKQDKKSAGEVSPHWRRGHWRNQRHGEGLKELKLVWIMPTIVKKAFGTPAKGHIYVDGTNN